MDDEVYELLCKAWDELRAGNYEEVDLLFDRILNRKWADVTECDGEYRMFRPDRAICHQHNFFAHALGLQVAVPAYENKAKRPMHALHKDDGELDEYGGN